MPSYSPFVLAGTSPQVQARTARLLGAGAKENGLDLAREVRKDRNIPIIMLTGKGDAIDRVVGLEVGANNGS